MAMVARLNFGTKWASQCWNKRFHFRKLFYIWCLIKKCQDLSRNLFNNITFKLSSCKLFLHYWKHVKNVSSARGQINLVGVEEELPHNFSIEWAEELSLCNAYSPLRQRLGSPHLRLIVHLLWTFWIIHSTLTNSKLRALWMHKNAFTPWVGGGNIVRLCSKQCCKSLRWLFAA